ncbi:acyl-CoA dehydrogenase [Azospirillum rugosum]|uniref:Alkylation response protein AidB-like acyl-CoA dehydrogenase n=1 Tax=Azospirillum rugosum TaxID=416170 RepID=A0ABS4SNP9_9PROT|nr:acyl-CoA dehydrogenase [Azospirillum rugosum]MBP2294186.1 alkylation response protein AidB-like acyl-CoA dehydrogenase [Azospirillum rugosum]MDQ0527425.1 alkylation response protein AidB-like acyl-CoA dehydrogenase [Azospirillum rugosum]
MIPYTAPVDDLRFVLNEVVGLDTIAALPNCESAAPDLVDAVLEEAGKFASGVLAPLNRVGDQEGSRLENGVVRTPTGWKEAYSQFTESGWGSLPFEPEYGGQGLPWTVAFAVNEMWQAANLSFGLCPLLTQGAVDLLTEHASEEQKALYLPKLIAGEWNGTMNLTEPQAGSDLAAVRTRAVRADDGTYRITGQKIFITYGEHDLTENIVHLVLARLPDAPPGIKGISLFIVPKFLPKADGTPGERNDLRCASLEHKLGIMASPTAVMAFGDNGGAVGFLVGQENRGIEYMFTMMNNARLGVGIQGVAIAERAYQQARDYAKTRVQSKDLAEPKGAPAPIIRHPDVRRMLLDMRAKTEASRALALYAGTQLDVSRHHEDPAVRAAATARVDILTPIVKAWSTDIGCDVASTGVQIHGGMGFIEETGAAQHYRDARITPIYEGTNGIHANDLTFRKTGRDGGESARAFIAEMRATVAELESVPGDDMEAIRTNLAAGLDALEQAVAWVVKTQTDGDLRAAAAGAANYLKLWGTVAGGWMLAKSAAKALEGLRQPGANAPFLEAKLVTARFYAEQILAQGPGLLLPILTAHRTVMALSEDQF